jgi:hypothetical protein
MSFHASENPIFQYVIVKLLLEFFVISNKGKDPNLLDTNQEYFLDQSWLIENINILLLIQ